MVAAAITISIFGTGRISQSATNFIKEGWEVIAMVFNSLLFLLVGLSVDIFRLFERIDAILIAVLFVMMARALSIYPMVPATISLFRLPHVTLSERHIMWWGGLKGGLAIAIVLSIPNELPGRDLLLDMTLGVVLFSLLVNAPTIRPLMHKLGIDRLSDDERAELKHALNKAEQHASGILQKLNRMVSLVAVHSNWLPGKRRKCLPLKRLISSSNKMPDTYTLWHYVWKYRK